MIVFVKILENSSKRIVTEIRGVFAQGKGWKSQGKEKQKSRITKECRETYCVSITIPSQNYLESNIWEDRRWGPAI